jgi:site-specific DNA-methyltransferase (adenine-specific)
MGYGGGNLAKIYKTGSEGRWPANFALSHSDDCADTCADDCAVKVLDEQSEGKMHSAGAARDGSTAIVADTYAASGYRLPPNRNMRRLGDSGGASRFFYQAKPSTKERSQGLADGARNTHTTVKSISLMRHLVSLIAAPGATILDPFTGSGSTGIAALAEGCHFVGIEREAEYVEIARQRIAAEAAKAR